MNKLPNGEDLIIEVCDMQKWLRDCLLILEKGKQTNTSNYKDYETVLEALTDVAYKIINND